MLVQVALPLPIDRLFTYGVPEDLEALAVTGARAVVPFGPHHHTGVIVAEATELEEGIRLRYVQDIPEDVQPLSPELMELARWLSEYYLTPLGEVFRTILPTGSESESRRRIIYRGEGDLEPFLKNKKTANLLAYLMEHPQVEWTGLSRKFKGLTLTTMRRLERAGVVDIRTVLRNPLVRVQVSVPSD